MKDKHPNNWVVAFLAFLIAGFVVAISVFTTFITLWLIMRLS
jgi:hypothetical protein